MQNCKCGFRRNTITCTLSSYLFIIFSPATRLRCNLENRWCININVYENIMFWNDNIQMHIKEIQFDVLNPSRGEKMHSSVKHAIFQKSCRLGWGCCEPMKRSWMSFVCWSTFEQTNWLFMNYNRLNCTNVLNTWYAEENYWWLCDYERTAGKGVRQKAFNFR